MTALPAPPRRPGAAALARIGHPVPAAEAADTSPHAFPDGGTWRTEIPSVEGPEALAEVLKESTRLDVPADLDPEVAGEVRRLSAVAFEALSCEGLARVDFFLLPDGRVVLNEINTMPGFTPTSMFPRMWAATGLEYPKLVGRLIRTALARGTGLH